jgi:ubiquinone biosynthesis protein UbiJ
MRALRNFAAEALAIHHEHRDRDLSAARELALFALEEAEEVGARAEPLRHRLARLERKIARPGKNRRTDTSGAQLFS